MKPPVESERDSICTNSRSVTVPVEAGAKLAQEIQYGSGAWETIYSHDRNTVEGANGFLKDGAHEGIDVPSRRRLRGSTAQFLMIAMLVVTGNLRKLQKFRDEMTEGSVEDRDKKKATKLSTRLGRHNSKNRIAPWDNFVAKNKAKDDAAAAEKLVAEQRAANRRSGAPPG